MSQTGTMPIALTNNNITVEDAAKILGCSYPHVINRINHGKIRAKKIGKSWLVDAEHVSELKNNRTIKPRTNNTTQVSGNLVSQSLKKMNPSWKSLGQDEIELTLKLSKNEYNLINLALENGKEKRNLKEHLEQVIKSLHEKVQKHISEVMLE